MHSLVNVLRYARLGGGGAGAAPAPTENGAPAAGARSGGGGGGKALGGGAAGGEALGGQLLTEDGMELLKVEGNAGMLFGGLSRGMAPCTIPRACIERAQAVSVQAARPLCLRLSPPQALLAPVRPPGAL
jgi:hypothetical protein